MTYPADFGRYARPASLRERLATPRTAAPAPGVPHHSPPRPAQPAPPPPRQTQPAPPPSRAVADRARQYRQANAAGLASYLFAAGIVALLIYGWMIRNDGYLSAEDGVGYWLGIGGGVLMLLLLVYPLRKRMSALRHLGSVRLWFRLHMLLGVIGPLLVLYHAGFQMGSINGSVALVSMLLVAGSGLIGRYLYVGLHRGLYGQRMQLRELLEDAGHFKHTLFVGLDGAAALGPGMQKYETAVLQPMRGLAASLWTLVLMRTEARAIEAKLRREIRNHLRARARLGGWTRGELRQHQRSAEANLRYYFAALHKAAKYQLFERLLSLWHVLHMPLFLFLILATTVHIVAVHQY